MAAGPPGLSSSITAAAPASPSGLWSSTSCSSGPAPSPTSSPAASARAATPWAMARPQASSSPAPTRRSVFSDGRAPSPRRAASSASVAGSASAADTGGGLRVAGGRAAPVGGAERPTCFTSPAGCSSSSSGATGRSFIPVRCRDSRAEPGADSPASSAAPWSKWPQPSNFRCSRPPAPTASPRARRPARPTCMRVRCSPRTAGAHPSAGLRASASAMAPASVASGSNSSMLDSPVPAPSAVPAFFTSASKGISSSSPKAGKLKFSLLTVGQANAARTSAAAASGPRVALATTMLSSAGAFATSSARADALALSSLRFGITTRFFVVGLRTSPTSWARSLAAVCLPHAIALCRAAAEWGHSRQAKRRGARRRSRLDFALCEWQPALPAGLLREHAGPAAVAPRALPPLPAAPRPRLAGRRKDTRLVRARVAPCSHGHHQEEHGAGLLGGWQGPEPSARRRSDHGGAARL